MQGLEERLNSQGKIHFICDDFTIGEILNNSLQRFNKQFSLDQVSSLRLFSSNFSKLDCLIIYHDRGQLENCFSKNGSPQCRFLPGVLESLTEEIGFLGKFNICILGFGLNREMITLFLELGVSNVFSLSEKDNLGYPNFRECLIQLTEWIKESLSKNKKNQRSLVVSEFLNSLDHWSLLSKKEQEGLQDNALTVLGDSATYSQLMAKSKLANQKPTDAQIWLERALIQNPNALEAQNLLAYLHLSAGHFQQAILLFEKSNLNNRLNPARFTAMGECYLGLQKLDQALKVLETALKLDPFYTHAKEVLGKVKWAQKDYTSASEMFAFVTDPNALASYLNSLGIALVEQKKYKEAIEHYRWAQKAIPSNSQSHLLLFNMGLAHIKAGQLNSGKRYFKLALSRKPGYQRAVAILNRIEAGEQPP